MNALAAMQAEMHDWLRHGDPAIAHRVEGPLVTHRLRIHADAYRLRLIEVLANDYPVTATLLGEDRLDAFAIAFIQSHPSTHPSVRHFGRGFGTTKAPKNQELKAKMVGVGNAVVSVSAELDYDKTARTTETFTSDPSVAQVKSV